MVGNAWQSNCLASLNLAVAYILSSNLLALWGDCADLSRGNQLPAVLVVILADIGSITSDSVDATVGCCSNLACRGLVLLLRDCSKHLVTLELLWIYLRDLLLEVWPHMCTLLKLAHLVVALLSLYSNCDIRCRLNVWDNRE